MASADAFEKTSQRQNRWSRPLAYWPEMFWVSAQLLFWKRYIEWRCTGNKGIQGKYKIQSDKKWGHIKEIRYECHDNALFDLPSPYWHHWQYHTWYLLLSTKVATCQSTIHTYLQHTDTFSINHSWERPATRSIHNANKMFQNDERSIQKINQLAFIHY
jgi:hypothetical protein